MENRFSTLHAPFFNRLAPCIGFPEELWYIIEKSLREDRDARYDDADEFRKELDGFIGARESEMKGELASMLTRLFPGQEERQARWEKAATSVRVPKFTMKPPAPVPVASASMLELAEDSAPQQMAAAPTSDRATPPSRATPVWRATRGTTAHRPPRPCRRCRRSAPAAPCTRRSRCRCRTRASRRPNRVRRRSGWWLDS